MNTTVKTYSFIFLLTCNVGQQACPDFFQCIWFVKLYHSFFERNSKKTPDSTGDEALLPIENDGVIIDLDPSCRKRREMRKSVLSHHAIDIDPDSLRLNVLTKERTFQSLSTDVLLTQTLQSQQLDALGDRISSRKSISSDDSFKAVLDSSGERVLQPLLTGVLSTQTLQNQQIDALGGRNSPSESTSSDDSFTTVLNSSEFWRYNNKGKEVLASVPSIESTQHVELKASLSSPSSASRTQLPEKKSSQNLEGWDDCNV